MYGTCQHMHNIPEIISLGHKVVSIERSWQGTKEREEMKKGLLHVHKVVC